MLRIWALVLALLTCAAPGYAQDDVSPEEREHLRALFALRFTQDAALTLAHRTYGIVERPNSVGVGGWTQQPIAVLLPPGAQFGGAGWSTNATYPEDRHRAPVNTPAWPGATPPDPTARLPRGPLISIAQHSSFLNDEASRPVTTPGGYFVTGGPSTPSLHTLAHGLPRILANPVDPAALEQAQVLSAFFEQLGYAPGLSFAARTDVVNDLDLLFKDAIQRRDFVAITELFVRSARFHAQTASHPFAIREAGLDAMRAAYIAHQLQDFETAATLSLRAADLLEAAIDASNRQFGAGGKSLDTAEGQESFRDLLTATPSRYTTYETYQGVRYRREVTITPPSADLEVLRRYLGTMQEISRHAAVAHAYALGYFADPNFAVLEFQRLSSEAFARLDGSAVSGYARYEAAAHRNMPSTLVRDTLANQAEFYAETSLMRSFYGYAQRFYRPERDADDRCEAYQSARAALLDPLVEVTRRAVRDVHGEGVLDDMDFADRICDLNRVPRRARVARNRNANGDEGQVVVETMSQTAAQARAAEMFPDLSPAAKDDMLAAARNAIDGINGATKNLELGQALYERACATGDLKACDAAGTNAVLVMKRPRDSERFYRQACDGGLASGCFSLASVVLYDKWNGSVVFLTSNRVSGDINHAAVIDAFELYERGCAGGDANSCLERGLLLMTHLSETPNAFERAFEEFNKACASSDTRPPSRSCVYAAQLAYHGDHGSAPNPDLANALLDRAREIESDIGEATIIHKDKIYTCIRDGRPECKQSLL